jgi:hypothetical protein
LRFPFGTEEVGDAIHNHSEVAVKKKEEEEGAISLLLIVTYP